jgi:hypothetical protein
LQENWENEMQTISLGSLKLIHFPQYQYSLRMEGVFINWFLQLSNGPKLKGQHEACQKRNGMIPLIINTKNKCSK